MLIEIKSNLIGIVSKKIQLLLKIQLILNYLLPEALEAGGIMPTSQA